MSMRDHLKRGGRHHSQSRIPWLKVALLAVVLICSIVVVLLLWLKGKQAVVRTNPETLCPVDRPPSEVAVILLDVSDVISEPQKLKVLNELVRMRDSIPRFGLVEVYTVDSLQRRVTTPLLHICNPGTGAEMSRVYQNPELARERWRAFSQHLEAALLGVMEVSESPTSPIFEAIQSAALRTLNLPQYDGVPKRLVIVSDLIQHMPGKLNQYENSLTFEQFRCMPYFDDIRCDLSGVSVTVLYLVRPRGPQKWPSHYLFWEEYFRASGAVLDRIEPVYGER